MTRRPISRRTAGLLAAGAVAATAATVAPAGAAAPAASAKPQKLTGLFKISARRSYFRMVFPGGSIARGQFFANPDSSAKTKSVTPIRPGTDGGLRTGAFQPRPGVAFTPLGDSRAARIIRPTAFAGRLFGLSTASRAQPGGRRVPAPSITVRNGRLSGQVQALTAEWNKLYFNQGSPKPGGRRPGLTRALTGSYNARTRAYVLQWSSTISGGPFNGFTGVWHLEGTFRAG